MASAISRNGAPFSTTCITARAVNVLLTEAFRKSLIGVTCRPCAISAGHGRVSGLDIGLVCPQRYRTRGWSIEAEEGLTAGLALLVEVGHFDCEPERTRNLAQR